MTTSSDRKKRLIVIQGPTGVGKTALAVALAEHYGIPVVSADSRQIYREMSIGTAVPSAQELGRAPHYFIQNKSIHESFTAGDYEREALELLEGELFTKTDDVLLAGGTGLYVDALLKGFDPLPGADEALRKELTATPQEVLLEELRVADPEYYETVDRSNPQRVIRAVEVCRLTGEPYSRQRSGRTKSRPFRALKVGIDLPDRESLYRRIDHRVDAMMEAGLADEARELYPFRELPALQTVGYRELFDYIQNRTTRDQAVELIKRNTRRYAKRQLTWLRRDPQIRWFTPTDLPQIIRYIDENL